MLTKVGYCPLWLATAATTEIIQTSPNIKKRPPRIFKNIFIIYLQVNRFILTYGIEEHPESQDCGNTVDAISDK
jgi:hypothetical protein